MAWLAISPNDVVSRMTETEATQCDTADPGTVTGFSRLATIITYITQYIRGRIAKFPNTRARMGPAGTIPDELYLSALNLCRYELLTALPHTESLLNDERKKEREQAYNDIKAAAEGDLVIEGPLDLTYSPDTSETGGHHRIGWFRRGGGPGIPGIQPPWSS